MGVLEGLKTGKSTLVGPVVGALVGNLVGALVEYGWDRPNPIIQGIWGFHFTDFSPPSTAGDASFFRRVPERASQSWSFAES